VTRRIAVVNQKGGVGKTTTSVSVAACAAEVGQRVLHIDLDPQADSTKWLTARIDQGTVMDGLTEAKSLTEIITNSNVPGVDVAPSGPDLLAAERQLGGDVGVQMVLAAAVDEVADRYDLILFDCPPALGLLTVSALVAATEVLVPVAMGPMEIDGIVKLLPTVELATKRLNPALVIGGVLPIKVKPRQRISRDVIEVLTTRFGDLVLPPIRDTVRIVEASSAREAITIYAPSEDVTNDYRTATRALLARSQK